MLKESSVDFFMNKPIFLFKILFLFFISPFQMICAENSNSSPNNIKGKIFIQSNVVNGMSILTQEMINVPNTIYIIQYDFNINTDITIPVDCILRFDGGSISGDYAIIGQNTGIEAGLYQIFGVNIIFSGTWNVNEINIKWFGAKGNNRTNDTRAFKNCLESPAIAQRTYKVLINHGIYLIDSTINLPYNGVYLSGVSREQLYYDETFKSCIRFVGENRDLFRVRGNTRSITIEKLCFKSYKQEKIDYRNNVAIKAMPEPSNTQTSKNITIRDCYFVGFGYCLYVSGIEEKIDWQCDNELIENCTFEYYAKGGIYMNSRNCFDYSLIESCSFRGRPIEDAVPAHGLDIRRCGFFKVSECAGSAFFDDVSEGSIAATNSAGVNIGDLSAAGNIVFEQIQFESVPNTINVYNISGGSRKLTFDNSVFDAPLNICGKGEYYFNECDFNSNVIIGGNDIELHNVPIERIALTNNDVGINSYDYIFRDNTQKTLYLRDLALLNMVDMEAEQLLNPHTKHYEVNSSSSKVKWHVVNTVNPFTELKAIKILLWGKFSIGDGGHINVKAEVDDGVIIDLGKITESDKINGLFIKEYMYCTKVINSYSNNFYLDVKNVNGSFDAKVEVIN